MVNRTPQHQLEDLSRDKFSMALSVFSPKWLFRDKNKDYGIDGEVEIFDSNGIATGLVFWVQIKATGSSQQKTIKSIDLNIEKIKYYKRLDIPVLIVRYSKVEDKFYVKWGQQIDLFYAKDNAKTMRVSFSDSDVLGEGKVLEIERYLQQLRDIKAGVITLPIKINLSFGKKNICNIPPSILRSKIRYLLTEFRDIIRLEENAEDIVADVYIDNKILKAGFLDIAGCTFDDVECMDEKTFPTDLIKGICLALSVALSKLGYHDLSARIIFFGDIQNSLKIQYHLLQYLIPSLLETDYFSETLNLIGDVFENEDNAYLEILQFFTKSLLLRLRDSGNLENAEKIYAVEIFLKREIERRREMRPSSCGISFYNLGNFYGSIGKHKDAVKCLLEARKYEPKYYNQGYFYAELAGFLFELGRFICSAKFYKKAIEIDEQKRYLPLYADALMFSGQYQKSVDVFAQVVESDCKVEAEWQLKFICLSTLIKKFDVEFQYRRIKEALVLSDLCSVEAEGVERNLEQALQQDMLCGLAWFKLGCHHNQNGNARDASFCFTMCALIERGHIEAWVNATVCSINDNAVPTQIFLLLMDCAYFYNGEGYVNTLYELVGNQFSEEQLLHFSQIIENVVNSQKKSKSPVAFRMLNDDGKFVNILEPPKDK